MTYRINRNPTGGEGGGASLAAGGPPVGAGATPPLGQPLNINITGAAPATQQGAGQGGQSPAKQQITLDAEVATALYQTAREFESYKASQAAAVEEAKAAKLTLEAQKAGIEKQFTEYRDTTTARLTTIQSNWLAAEKARTIAGAVSAANVRFVSEDAAKQVHMILESMVKATMSEAGTPNVFHESTGRPAADVIKETLTSPAFAHFLAADHRGGAGAQHGAGGQSQGAGQGAGQGGQRQGGPTPNDLAAIEAWQTKVHPHVPIGNTGLGAVFNRTG